LTPGVDGGHRKAYDGAVFRSESESRTDVRARAHLYGELRRVGCVRYKGGGFKYGMTLKRYKEGAKTPGAGSTVRGLSVTFKAV
jgi:hypothetical protein